MKLDGDEEGLAQLTELHAENKTYMKFLVDEARTNTELKAEFRGKNGTLYELILDPKSGDLLVRVASAQRPSRLPPAD